MEEFRSMVRRLILLLGAFTGILLLIPLLLYLHKTKTPTFVVVDEPATVLDEWLPETILKESPDVSPLVKKGFLFVSQTSQEMGPLASQEADRFSGNNLSCTNCHLNGGALPGSASWVHIVDRFPQFGGRANAIGTLEDRINGCMERSMNGKKLAEDAPQMKAIIAYMDWLGSVFPKEIKTFKGYPAITIPTVAVDLEKGKSIYTKECTLCHGVEGQGVLRSDPNQGYEYPPLWGADSYNDGAGMHRVITAAAFIKNNMPFGQATWQAPKLTDEEAFHVAGYINSFERPHKQNTEADYPDKKLKPVSTPYGPWADTFSPTQHKYGPFPPIIDFYLQSYSLKKTK